MVKVIETNISLNSGDEFIDSQSRVIEADSWNSFVNEVKEGKTVVRNSFLGNMHGSSIPRESRVVNLEYDNFHLSCDIYNYKGVKTKKLAYLIE